MPEKKPGTELKFIWVGFYVGILCTQPWFPWFLREGTYLNIGSHMWWTLLKIWMEKKWMRAWHYSSSRGYSQVCDTLRLRASWAYNTGGESSIRKTHYFFFYSIYYFLEFIPIPTTPMSHTWTFSQVHALFLNIIVKYLCIYICIHTHTHNLICPFSVGHVYMLQVEHMDLDKLLMEGWFYLSPTSY